MEHDEDLLGPMLRRHGSKTDQITAREANASVGLGRGCLFCCQFGNGRDVGASPCLESHHIGTGTEQGYLSCSRPTHKARHRHPPTHHLNMMLTSLYSSKNVSGRGTTERPPASLMLRMAMPRPIPSPSNME